VATSTTTQEQDFVPASLWRRLLSIVYDTLIVVCLVFIAWQPVPFILDESWPAWLTQTLRRGYLVTVIFGFFGWFWTHGGQTVGMRAWKIRVIDDTGDQPRGSDSDGTTLRVSWRQALVRFVVAIVSLAALGLGFLWSLFNARGNTWHDSASGTRLVEIV